MTTPNDSGNASNATTSTATSEKASKNTSTDTKATGKDTGLGGVKVRLLARSWQVPFEDDRGKITFLRYFQGDELEVTEETYEALAGTTAFKPAFELVNGDAQVANS